jgi:hypothetical protein
VSNHSDDQVSVMIIAVSSSMIRIAFHLDVDSAAVDLICKKLVFVLKEINRI